MATELVQLEETVLSLQEQLDLHYNMIVTHTLLVVLQGLLVVGI